MPMKKKKGGKKKKSSGEDVVEGLGLDGEPSSLISATNEDGTLDLAKDKAGKGGKKKKKGKGKKKKKIPKSEKDLEKLEKAAEKLKSNKAFFIPFINRMDKWLVNNSKLALELFREFDQEEELVINYDDFKAGMFDLGVICSKHELHLLAKLLDRENSGDIEYTNITKGLGYVRELEEIEKESEEAENILITTDRDLDHCKKCKMAICEPYRTKTPKFILLELRFVTFDGFKNHPWHLEELIPTHIPVCGILQMIMETTGIQSTKLAMFVDKSRNRESMLPPELTLGELGYEGGSQTDPEEVTFYYDYKVEFTDCPILLCDSYIGEEIGIGSRKKLVKKKGSAVATA